MSERISEAITFHFDNVEQQKRFHERLEGLTPSKHGFSAALRAQGKSLINTVDLRYRDEHFDALLAEIDTVRAQVIEECAKVAEQAERDYLSPEYATGQPMSSLAERIACRSVAASIRSLSAVPPIAQGRSMKHHIERTSPKGEKFIGTCRLCGQAGLAADDALKDCPNVRGLSQEEAIIETIDGPHEK